MNTTFLTYVHIWPVFLRSMSTKCTSRLCDTVLTVSPAVGHTPQTHIISLHTGLPARCSVSSYRSAGRSFPPSSPCTPFIIHGLCSIEPGSHVRWEPALLCSQVSVQAHLFTLLHIRSESDFAFYAASSVTTSFIICQSVPELTWGGCVLNTPLCKPVLPPRLNLVMVARDGPWPSDAWFQ